MEVVAHRGGAAEAPENTWSAVEHTVDAGLTWMETDLRATADGVVLLWHDPDLVRTTGVEGVLRDLTWEEVCEVDAGDGRAPVRLADVLASFPSLGLNVDLKEDAVVAPALAAVGRAGAWRRVRFASFSSRRLRQVRSREPRARTSLGTTEVVGLVSRSVSAVGVGALSGRGLLQDPGTGRWVRPRPGAVRRLVRPSWLGRADAVQVPVRRSGVVVVGPRVVAAAHEAGLEVHVWTVNDPAQMRWLERMGVDAVVTDVPTLAQEVLGG